MQHSMQQESNAYLHVMTKAILITGLDLYSLPMPAYWHFISDCDFITAYNVKLLKLVC